MGYFEYKAKLESMLYFINCQTNNVDMLSQKLNISRRTVLRMVDNLKTTGINVKYCKKRKTYYIEKTET